jgi:outer membrane protein TolC
MSRLFRLSLLAGTSALLLAGCASVPVTEVAPLNARIEQATGQALNTTRENSADRTARIDALLAEPLSPEMAARIAIASSPRVEAAFGELGIARADYLEGALPSNPMIHAARLLKKDGGSPSLSYGFGLDLLSLITLPARRASAKGGWEAAKARAVGETLMVAGNGRLAMIDFIAANQNLDLMRQANEASQAALVAAEAIFEAGNSPRVEVDRERLFAAEIALSLKQAEADLVPARERVNVALGLSASQRAVWTAARRLPAPPTEPIDVDGAEANVVAASTDLAAATGALRAARAMRSTSGLTSLLPGLELSGERERDDGEWKRGLAAVSACGHKAKHNWPARTSRPLMARCGLKREPQQP